MTISSDAAQAAVPQLWHSISTLEQALSMEELDIYILRQHAQLLNSKQRYYFLTDVLNALNTLHREAQNVQQLINERASIQAMLAEVDPTDDEHNNSVLQKMLVNNLVQLVEAVQRWRGVMTQPLPVLSGDGSNYLLWLLMDLVGHGELAVVQETSAAITSSPSNGNMSRKDHSKRRHRESQVQNIAPKFTLENSGHFPYSYAEPKHALSDIGYAGAQEFKAAIAFLKEDYGLQIELWRRKKNLLERHRQVEPLLRVVMDSVGLFTIPEHLVPSYEANVTDCLRLTSHSLQRNELEKLGLSKPSTRLDWKLYFGNVKPPVYFAQVVKTASVVEQLNAANAAILLRTYIETWKRFHLWKESWELAREMCLLAEQAQRRMRFRSWLRFIMARRHQAVAEMAAQRRVNQLQVSLSALDSARLAKPQRALSMSTQSQPMADSDLSVMTDRGEMGVQVGRARKPFSIVR